MKTNALTIDVYFLITNVNIDAKSAMTRINAQVIPAGKVMGSVCSNQLRGVFARRKVHLVRPQDNVVAVSVERRNASNSCTLEIYVELIEKR